MSVVQKCTRICSSTAVAFPKLRFEDAAGNKSSALMKLAVCSEHMTKDREVYMAQINFEAAAAAHEGRYGIRPVRDLTAIEYVMFSEPEATSYMKLLAQKEQKGIPHPEPKIIPVEVVSREEFKEAAEMAAAADRKPCAVCGFIEVSDVHLCPGPPKTKGGR